MGHDADADASPPSAASSLKQRLRSSICLSCCFRGAASGGGGDEDRPASLIRSSTVWLRAKAKELSEIGGTCRGLVARMGRHHHGGRRHACDCRYDPLSYSLNFDEGPDDDLAAAGEQPLQNRGFSSRLPPSPPPTAPPPPRPTVGISC